MSSDLAYKILLIDMSVISSHTLLITSFKVTVYISTEEQPVLEVVLVSLLIGLLLNERIFSQWGENSFF